MRKLQKSWNENGEAILNSSNAHHIRVVVALRGAYTVLFRRIAIAHKDRHLF